MLVLLIYIWNLFDCFLENGDYSKAVIFFQAQRQRKFFKNEWILNQFVTFTEIAMGMYTGERHPIILLLLQVLLYLLDNGGRFYRKWAFIFVMETGWKCNGKLQPLKKKERQK